MNHKISFIPSWLIWAVTLFAISLGFILYLFYSPANIISPNISSQHKLNNDVTNSTDITMLLNMQKQLMLEMNALKISNEKNINEILLIKQIQDSLQSSLNNDDINHQDFLLNNKNKVAEVTEEEMKLEQQEYMQSIDEFFVSQNEDSVWTNQVTNDFEIAFDNYSDQATLHDVSCGSSICKINATISTEQISSENPMQLDHLINGDAEWTGQSFYELNTETGSVIVYLMREGEEFPQAN